MTPMFAFLDNVQGAMNELANNLLLVAGGFLVGYLVGWVGGWALGRWVFRMKDTYGVKVVARPVGGFIGALIVALVVFTGKGKPHGEGGDGKGTTATDPNGGKNPPPKNEQDPKTPNPELKKPPEAKPADVLLAITLYAGRGDKRHYQFDAETELRDFESVQKAILARKGVEKGKLALILRLPTDPNDHPGDPRVRDQLTQWANAQGLDVTSPANK